MDTNMHSHIGTIIKRLKSVLRKLLGLNRAPVRLGSSILAAGNS
jgi:hypothetical protein